MVREELLLCDLSARNELAQQVTVDIPQTLCKRYKQSESYDTTSLTEPKFRKTAPENC